MSLRTNLNEARNKDESESIITMNLSDFSDFLTL